MSKRTSGLIHLPEELVVALNVNDRFVTKISCSPFEQRELALGWMFWQGLIESRSEVVRTEIEDGQPKMRVWLSEPFSDRLDGLHAAQKASCGGGSYNSRLFGTLRPLYRPYKLDLETVQAEASPLVAPIHPGLCRAVLTKQAGGLVMVSREDLSGQNALDKVVGHGLEAGADFAGQVLHVGADISADLVLRCYRAGISTLITPGLVTSLAFDLAVKTGLTLVGRVLSDEPMLINF